MQRALKVIFGLWLFLFLLVGVCLGSFYSAYRGKVLSGVTLNHFPLGNRSYAMTATLLDNYFESIRQRDLVLIFNGERVVIPHENLGVTYDTPATAREAMAVGRRGGIRQRFADIYGTFHSRVEIKPVYILNTSLLRLTLNEASREHSLPQIDATYYLSGENLNIKPETLGREVALDDLVVAVEKNLASLEDTPVVVPFKDLPALVTASDLTLLKPQVEKIIKSPWEFVAPGRVFLPSTAEKISFLSVFKVSPGTPASIQMNAAGVKNYLTSFKPQVETQPQAGLFEVQNGRVVKFSPPINGVSLNEDVILKDVSESIVNPPPSFRIEMPLVVAYAPGLANDYGIAELLGEGYSQFRGSLAGRVHNIGLAASRVNGVLVPPGEIFSFNQSVGEISVVTGYDQAYIIADRRTVMGTGGGVCQVSTTVFRAGLNAGLEVVERHAHAYRVGYYEPPGLDATVYNPSMDLSFRNNTPRHILFISEFNPQTSELRFKVYGTNDGREVTLLGPNVIGKGAPPAPIYQDDPSLPVGTTKQVDWAAWGAYVTVQRLVRLNGATLIDEVIKSSYSPWQAVYLVGTKK